MDSVWENEIELEIILDKEVKMAENVNEGPISCCLYLREHRGFFVFVFEDLWTWKQKTVFNEDSISWCLV